MENTTEMEVPKPVLGRKVILAGNPNSGKSTLFNLLTGLKQKVGNYAGVTVEKKSGKCRLENGSHLEIIDLPGTYSLRPDALDEKLAAQILTQKDHPDHPEQVVYVADASNLKRSLFLFTQLKDLELPLVLVINMLDVAQKQGIDVDGQQLEDAFQVPVIMLNGRSGAGVSELKQILQKPAPEPITFVQEVNALPRQQSILKRYQKIAEAIAPAVQQQDRSKNSFTRRLDKILLHRVWGFAIFLIILFLIFQSVFSLSETPMDWIEQSLGWLADSLHSLLPEGPINTLLTSGIIPGLAGVLVFIPQIVILFFLLALLEDSGYMARVSFLMDRLLRKFGLNGRSVIPLISGMACAIPAIMSARSIGNWKERLITIIVTPLMSCSARLPVYTLLIALVIPNERLLGVIDLQGLVMMGLYLIGFVAAIGSAVVMKFLLKAREKSYFLMEMPHYRAPQWKDVTYTIFEKVRVFVWDAGKVIVAISIILWVLASYGPGNQMAQIEEQLAEVEAGGLELSEGEINDLNAKRLEASYIGHLGKFIEPSIAPLGYDWKIGIGLIASFAAREVFVGTMATIYSVGDEENTQSLKEQMQSDVYPGTNQPVYTLATGLSLLLFYAFAMQCMSTLAVVYRETQGWKWPVIQLVFMTALAYVSSWLVFQIFA